MLIVSVKEGESIEKALKKIKERNEKKINERTQTNNLKTEIKQHKKEER